MKSFEDEAPMPVKRDYRVIWEIDVEAASPREAAELARAHQKNPGSHATVFDVHDCDGEAVRVDLMEPIDDLPDGQMDGLLDRFSASIGMILPDGEDGYQWSAQDLAIIKDRNQSALVFNEIRPSDAGAWNRAWDRWQGDEPFRCSSPSGHVFAIGSHKQNTCIYCGEEGGVDEKNA